METKQGLPIIAFASQCTWEEWLATNHASSNGLWLKIAKKDSGIETVSYAEALESALCYGWIDGQKGAHDDQYWLQRFTRRGARSKWSHINRDKAAELIAQGRMKPAGLAHIEQARKNGRWDAAYDGPRSAAIPEDLERELEMHPAAKAYFDTLSNTNRYAILYRLQDARKPETRARRLADFIVRLNEGKKLYP